MAIMISSVSPTVEPEFGPALPTPIMEDTMGYIPPRKKPSPTTRKFPP